MVTDDLVNLHKEFTAIPSFQKVLKFINFIAHRKDTVLLVLNFILENQKICPWSVVGMYFWG